MLTRRTLLKGIGAGAGGLLVGGCDTLNESERFRAAMRTGEQLSMGAHRLLSARDALAAEFTAADLSPTFRSNGTAVPGSPRYQQLAAGNWADWRLIVDGLVQRPLSLTLDQIRSGPRRTQITRHDCVEGWSAIGQWTGTPLDRVLAAAGLRPEARYIVFHCMDLYGQNPYYESIDLIDAFHPQTILAYGLNGATLPVVNGAPLRLRVERQLGYKQAKYIERIEARDTLAGVQGGRGGYWEDVADYDWYAGI